MSSKKIFAASLAAILATGSVAAVALAEAPADSAAANDEYTVVIDGLGAGKAFTDSATLKVSTGIWASEFAADKAAIDDANGDVSKLGISKVQAGIWEAYSKFNITSTASATMGLNTSGFAQQYANDMIVQKTVDSTTGEVGTKAYPISTYLPKIKDGKKLVLEVTLATAGEVAIGDTLEITGVLDTDGTITAITPVTVATAEAGDAGNKADDVNNFINKLAKMKQADINTLLLGADAAVATDNGQTSLAAQYKTALGVEAAPLVTVSAECAAVSLGTTWKNATNKPAGAGWVTEPTSGKGMTLGPVTFEPKFEGLGDTLKLVSVNGAWFQFDAEFTVDGATYDNYVDGKYSVSGAAADWDASQWNTSSGQFKDGANFGLAVVASSDIAAGAGVAANNGGYSSTGTGSYPYANGKGWIAGVLDDELTEDPAVTTKNKDLYITENGSLNLSYYGVVNPNVLKNLNNGGTVTFTLDKDLDKATLYGAVEYLGADGWHIINADDSYAVSGNEITFNFPAGLTYHENLKDKWHPFSMAWDLSVRDNGSFGGSIWENPGDAAGSSSFDGKIVKMTFKANTEAPVADDPTSDPTGDDPTSDPSIINPGDENSNGGDTSNNGGDTNNGGNTGGNPNTGIALAIAPAILAAGAAATIVAKKRK